MNNWVLLPPLVFLIMLGAGYVMSFVSSAVSLRGAKPSHGKTKAYACGEDISCHRVRPDYSQFFPFAFFFTIMHVVALMVATIPGGAIKLYTIAALYLIVAVSALFILFRK